MFLDKCNYYYSRNIKKPVFPRISLFFYFSPKNGRFKFIKPDFTNRVCTVQLVFLFKAVVSPITIDTLTTAFSQAGSSYEVNKNMMMT